jgi:hypothetical protein
MAGERSAGCGRVREIEMVGDLMLLSRLDVLLYIIFWLDSIMSRMLFWEQSTGYGGLIGR